MCIYIYTEKERERETIYEHLLTIYEHLQKASRTPVLEPRCRSAAAGAALAQLAPLRPTAEALVLRGTVSPRFWG